MLLKPKYRQMLFDIFSELTLPVEVWAYGSRVKGTAHDGSDLDLVVRTQDGEKLPIDLFMELQEKFVKAMFPSW